MLHFLAARMIKKITIFCFLWMAKLQLFAQCAMCNETARTSTSTKMEEAEALNDGIVYLLVTPYLVIGTVIAITIYLNRKAKKKQEVQQ